MNIYLSSDHAGLELKKHILQLIKDFKIKSNDSSEIMTALDLGPFSVESVDFPDYANLVCEKIKLDPTSYGILICGSGQGMALRANKYSYIRAALVYNDDIAKLSREHNDANIICLGSRFCGTENAEKWINIFINTAFSEGRHRQRVDKISSST